MIHPTNMSKSARLPRTIALLLISLLTAPYLPITAAVSQEMPAAKAENTTRSKKSKRKKRKKKSKPAPELFLAMPIATSLSPAVPNVIPATAISSPPSRSAPRIQRTPGVHVTPLAIDQVAAPSFSGQNSSPITIAALSVEPGPIPAEPYSSDIEVSNLTGTVTSVSVTINSLIHSSPDDLDMLLVSPDGRAFHFWSDVGGEGLLNGRLKGGNPVPTGISVEPITVTIADTGNLVLPDDGPLVSGTT
jgi:hypothetical protein